jgi:hypothetical protein
MTHTMRIRNGMSKQCLKPVQIAWPLELYSPYAQKIPQNVGKPEEKAGQ